MKMKEKLAELNKKFEGANPIDVLRFVLAEHKCKAAFSTSLGAEDQVVTKMIVEVDDCAKIFTLDTGRQFYEAYDTIDKTNAKYGINIEVIFPDHTTISIEF